MTPCRAINLTLHKECQGFPESIIQDKDLGCVCEGYETKVVNET